jgi:hypothetical protein
MLSNEDVPNTEIPLLATSLAPGTPCALDLSQAINHKLNVPPYIATTGTTLLLPSPVSTIAQFHTPAAKLLAVARQLTIWSTTVRSLFWLLLVYAYKQASQTFTGGSKDDYNHIAHTTGDNGWSWNSIQTYKKKVEKYVSPADGHDAVRFFVMFTDLCPN